MFETPEKLELWIVRSLDGELSADEQLELDRELIRNPEARRLRDEYRGVDAMSIAALASLDEPKAVPRSQTVPPPQAAMGAAPKRQAWRVNRLWLIPGAIAAALLALAVPRPLWDGDPARPPLIERSVVPAWPGGGLVQPVSTRPSVHRATGRDLVGVIGEDGNIYWVEVERTRTVRLPHGPAGADANRL